MKQNITFLAAMLFTLASTAQIPAGYYNSATGTGYTLKTQLKKIIDDANDGLSPEYQSSDLGYGALYITYQTSDSDNYYENNGTVLDMYSEKPLGADDYEYTHITDKDNGTGGTAEGQYYNREHTIPQSVFNSSSPMKNDAHFVIPSDKYVNGQRGNLPYGVVDVASKTFTNGTKKGNNLNSGYSAGYTGNVFEPIDEFKGDIARLFFYFAVRYEDQITGFNAYDMFDGSADKVFDQTFLNILYQWHTQDPVSQREIDRNNAIFARQNNRNPFIDHPEYVLSIWQNSLSVADYTADNFNIHPNPTHANLAYISKGNIKVKALNLYSITGKLVLSQKVKHNQSTLVLSNLDTIASGIYLLKIQTDNNTVVKKLVIN